MGVYIIESKYGRLDEMSSKYFLESNIETYYEHSKMDKIRDCILSMFLIDNMVEVAKSYSEIDIIIKKARQLNNFPILAKISKDDIDLKSYLKNLDIFAILNEDFDYVCGFCDFFIKIESLEKDTEGNVEYGDICRQKVSNILSESLT